MRLPEGAIVEVVRARLVTDYRIELHFSDGVQRVVDFEPFLRESSNPLIRAYLDREKFERFRIVDGDLMWGDFDLCFPIADLYENRI